MRHQKFWTEEHIRRR